MQKIILRLGIPLLVLAASIFLLGNSKAETKSIKPVKERKSTCCKKTPLNCAEPEKPAAEDLILENLSRQFISISHF